LLSRRQAGTRQSRLGFGPRSASLLAIGAGRVDGMRTCDVHATRACPDATFRPFEVIADRTGVSMSTARHAGLHRAAGLTLNKEESAAANVSHDAFLRMAIGFRDQDVWGGPILSFLALVWFER
jgi:hypothetical protein